MAGHFAGQRFTEGDDPALSPGVHSLTHAAHAAGVTGDVDNLTCVALDHWLEKRTGYLDRPHQVDANDLLPEIGSIVDKWLNDVPAGDIGNSVDLTCGSMHLLSEGFDRAIVADVERQESRTATHALGHRCGLGPTLLVDITQKHPRASLTQCQNRGTADARGTTSHNNTFSIHLHLHCLLTLDDLSNQFHSTGDPGSQDLTVNPRLDQRVPVKSTRSTSFIDLDQDSTTNLPLGYLISSAIPV